MLNCTLRFSGRVAYNRSNNCLRKYYPKNQNSSGHQNSCFATSTIFASNNNNNNNNSSILNVINFEDKSSCRPYSSWPPKNQTDRSMSGPSPSVAAVSPPDEKPPTPAGAIPPYTNRLIDEKSPYLLQHAHNPVDWYPWGNEAIEKARRENKPIFLSVGYSTCHWCHVMEKESFENPDVAEVMNRHFINIKVDREERPDIDKIYMQFVLMINQSGGWPMSVWLTPDLTPITGGTYFPPNQRYGMPGFVTVLEKIAKLWQEKGAELSASGLKVVDIIEKSANEGNASAEVDDASSVEHRLNEGIRIYKQNIDDVWGGFGAQTKFPEVSKLNFALHAHVYKPDSEMASLALKTLRNIANGGIHDHVFGGFCRYSVDRQWHIPHFEKMLYDQGQLMAAYSNAYKLTNDPFYLDVCDKIYEYLRVDLRHPNGGFFSGEDADSYREFGDAEKIEGAFYAWTFDEVQQLFEENSDKFALDLPALDVYRYYYGIEPSGNVPPTSDPHGHLVDRNILRVRTTLEETAKRFVTDVDHVRAILETGNKILREERKKRPRPHLDSKILTAWNGLVLSGLSKLACITSAPRRQEYLRTARELVEFMRKNAYRADKQSLIRACYGKGVGSDETAIPSVPIEGFLDDYAFFIHGLIDYYVATLDIDAMRWAKELQDTQDRLFWDEERGGYYYSQANSTNIIVRLKEDHDGAEPCGNSVSAHNLMLISAYFDDKSYKRRALKLFEFFSSASPFSYVLPEMFSAQLMQAAHLSMMVVVGPNNEASQKLIDVARDFLIPNLVLLHHNTDEPIEAMTRPSAAKFKMVRNEPTVYLCHNRVCQLPITNPDDFRKILTEKCLPEKCTG